jgi:hypothetical protein
MFKVIVGLEKSVASVEFNKNTAERVDIARI